MSERREEVKDVIYTGKEPFDVDESVLAFMLQCRRVVASGGDL